MFRLDTYVSLPERWIPADRPVANRGARLLLFAVLVALLLLATVPLIPLLLVATLLNVVWPRPVSERGGQATVFVFACIMAEVLWFGGLVWQIVRIAYPA